MIGGMCKAVCVGLPVLIWAGAASAQTLMTAEGLQAYVTGKTVTGSNPETGAVVGTVTYAADGSSVLTLGDGVAQAGSYRFEGNAYCTRYATFRDNTENCFTLEDLGDGRVQAYYTDGRTALILTPE